VLDHARQGAADKPPQAAFAACRRLFLHYSLAVRRHYAEHRYGSLVLLHQIAGRARFYVLIMERDQLFVLRHWDRRDGHRVEIGPETCVPAAVGRLIEASVPVPRDGALLGWVAGHQVQAVVAAYGRLPEPWDDAAAVPGVLVMPRSGSQPARWPPLTASPLADGRLWDCVARGQLIDLGPLVTRQARRVYWVPGAGERSGRPTGSCVVVTERISGDGYWLPAGVYADHWTLRGGSPVLLARDLLARPGVTDLAGGRGAGHLLGV
jgi:hypothetical protein